LTFHSRQPISEDERSSGRNSAQEKWKLGAKKALLQWCQAQVTKNFGIQVSDFGKSWRDGNAFLGIVNSIRPGILTGLTKHYHRMGIPIQLISQIVNGQ
jgi:hypothetical protein